MNSLLIVGACKNCELWSNDILFLANLYDACVGLSCPVRCSRQQKRKFLFLFTHKELPIVSHKKVM